MTDNIFEETPQQEKVDNEVTFEQKVAEQLASIKREDGSQMFDSVEKALESLAHAQKIIPTLKEDLKAKEEEVASMATQLEKAATVEDVISRINNSPNETNSNEGVDKVNKDEIGKLVEEQIKAMRESESSESNRRQVNEALVAKYGDAESAKLALKAKAEELGVGPEFFVSMAEKSPKAVLAYFDKAEANPAPVTNPNPSSVNLRKDDVSSNSSKVEEFSIYTTSSRDQADKMRAIREEVYKELGVVV